ncbi:MAG: hypothetical protein CR217_03600 [Beijerinckiaceae bacterium]|nr:MAG: hypothetical protein CR217_03600 [Beijerinckiaceae bacterium]
MCGQMRRSEPNLAINGLLEGYGACRGHVGRHHGHCLRARAYPSRADQIYGADANPKPQLAPSRLDRALFHRSGTRGRQGLGASPLHPEGPGNVTR